MPAAAIPEQKLVKTYYVFKTNQNITKYCKKTEKTKIEKNVQKRKHWRFKISRNSENRKKTIFRRILRFCGIFFFELEIFGNLRNNFEI